MGIFVGLGSGSVQIHGGKSRVLMCKVLYYWNMWYMGVHMCGVWEYGIVARGSE